MHLAEAVVVGEWPAGELATEGGLEGEGCCRRDLQCLLTSKVFDADGEGRREGEREREGELQVR